MILLDTNVLVYAVGGPHPLRDAATELVAGLRDSRLDGNVIDPVYVELLWVLARRRPRALAAQVVRGYLEVLGPPLPVRQRDRHVAIDLYERHERLESVDALLAAVALGAEVDALVTADRAFADVPGLRALDPRSPEVARMLA